MTRNRVNRTPWWLSGAWQTRVTWSPDLACTLRVGGGRAVVVAEVEEEEEEEEAAPADTPITHTENGPEQNGQLRKCPWMDLLVGME